MVQDLSKRVGKAVSRAFNPARQQLSSQRAELTRQQALLNEQRNRLKSQEIVRGVPLQQRQSFSSQISQRGQQLQLASSQLETSTTQLSKQERDIFEKEFKKARKAEAVQIEKAFGGLSTPEGEILVDVSGNVVTFGEPQIDVVLEDGRFRERFDPGIEFTQLGQDRFDRFTPIPTQQEITAARLEPVGFRQRVLTATGGLVDIPESRLEARERLIQRGIIFPSKTLESLLPGEKGFQSIVSGGQRLLGEIPGEIPFITSTIPVARRETVSPKTFFFVGGEPATFTGRDVGTIIGGGTAITTSAILGTPSLIAGSGLAFGRKEPIRGAILGGLAILPSAAGFVGALGQRAAPGIARVLTNLEQSQLRFLSNKRGQLLVRTSDWEVVIINGRKAFRNKITGEIRETGVDIGIREIDLLARDFDNLARTDLGTLTRTVLEDSLKRRIKNQLDNLKGDQLRINNLKEQFRRNFGTDGERLFNRAISELETVQITGVVPTRRPRLPGQPRETTIPPRLGDVFQSQGAFAGTGQFERTSEVGFRTPLSQQLNLRSNLLRPQVGSRDLILQQPRIRTFGLFSQLSLQPQAQRDLQLQRLTQQQTEQQRARQRLQLGLSLGLTQQELQRQRQRQLLRLGQPQVPRIPGELGKPEPGLKVPPVLLPGGAARLKKNLAKLKRQAKAFDVFIKRKGKFVKIADDLPFNRALKKGATRTRETLAAQFKIVADKGKKPKLKDIKFKIDPKVFRDFKIKGGVAETLPIGHLIERRNKRITSGGEISEILRAQKTGKEKRKRRRKLRTPLRL